MLTGRFDIRRKAWQANCSSPEQEENMKGPKSWQECWFESAKAKAVVLSRFGFRTGHGSWHPCIDSKMDALQAAGAWNMRESRWFCTFFPPKTSTVKAEVKLKRSVLKFPQQMVLLSLLGEVRCPDALVRRRFSSRSCSLLGSSAPPVMAWVINEMLWVL